MHLDKNSNPERFFIPRRVIYDYEMYYVVEGEVDCVFDDRVLKLRKGDVHFMPPFVWHKRVVPAGSSCTHYSVHFDLDYIEADDFDQSVYIIPCLEREVSVPIDEKLAVRQTGQIVINGVMKQALFGDLGLAHIR